MTSRASQRYVPTPKQGDSSASKPSDDTQHPPVAQISVASNVEVGSLADDTYASSNAPSNRTERLANLFPDDKSRFSKFKADSNILKLLKEIINLPEPFIARMEAVGYTTPAIIVNRFGLSQQSIAESFALLGPSYVLDQPMHQSTMSLVMFARSQVLKGHIIKSPGFRKSWSALKKVPAYNRTFNKSNDDAIEELKEILTDTKLIREAEKEMRGIRSKIRKWARSGAVSGNQDGSTTTAPLPSANKVTPSIKASKKTPPDNVSTASPHPTSPPPGTVDRFIQDIEEKMETFNAELTMVKSTVKKEIDNGVTERLQATIDHRATDAVRQSLSKFFKPEVLPTSAISSHQPSSITSQSQNEQQGAQDVEEEIHTPPPAVQNFKSQRRTRLNKRASHYNNRGTYEVPTSPWDHDFEVGCNDDVIDGTDVSLNTEQCEKVYQTKEFMRKARLSTRQQTATLCTSNVPLKRSPLPSHCKWNGNSGSDFESFIDKFTGHVIQQSHMGYLLLDEIHIHWLQYGDLKDVLEYGITNNIHQSLHHISPTQLADDITWLFGAMKQSIVGRGRNIILDHEATQDGILAWKRFVDTFRYDGDVDVYLAQQQAVLNTRYHPKYPGGPIKFLEAYETAFMNIDYVLRRKRLNGDHRCDGYYTDDGKRRLFVQNFSVINHTADLIDNVVNNTETWDAMVDDLRRRLARRDYLAKTTARHQAHQTISYESLVQDTPTPIVEGISDTTPSMSDDAYINLFTSPAFINALSQDWKVGYPLWQQLPQRIKDDIITIRKQHLPLDSGGG